MNSLQTIVELPEFVRRAAKLLGESERQSLVSYVAEFPRSGVIMRGTGGIRKLRWRRVLAMSDAFESIKTGLEQAISHTKGEPNKAIVHEVTPLDVKAIRSNVGMTQREFAASFGISLGTLRHWERGDRQPQGPARVLLNVLAKKPAAVLDVLASGT